MLNESAEATLLVSVKFAAGGGRESQVGKNAVWDGWTGWTDWIDGLWVGGQR